MVRYPVPPSYFKSVSGLRTSYLLGALLALLVFLAGGAQARTWKIAAYRDGPNPYSLFAHELAHYLEETGPDDFTLEVLETHGSVENIQSLYADPDVVLAISQENVAHFFYTGSNNPFFIVNREQDYRLTGLGRIFQEQAYLVVDPSIEELGDISRMYVGEPHSGTYATYLSLKSYNSQTRWEEVTSGDRLQLFQDGAIDAFFDVASTPHTELLDLRDAGVAMRMLPVERTELSLGLDIYRNTTVADSLSPSGESFRTVSVPAVLLAKRSLPYHVSSLILEALYDKQVQARWFPRTLPYMKAMRGDLRTTDGTPRNTDPRFADLPLPPHPSVVRLTLGSFPYGSFAIGLGIVVLGWLVWWQLPRFSLAARAHLAGNARQRLLHRDVNFLFGALVWVFLCAWGIKFLEIHQLLSGRTVSGSGFVHMNVGDLVRWLVVFCITGYEDTVFPDSSVAKILAVSVQIVGLALLTWTGARLISYLVSKLMEKKTMQNFSQMQGHVLVCNWNIHGVRLLEELRNPRLPAKKLRRKIIVLSTALESPVPVDDFEDVIHVAADPWDQMALHKSGAERADSIIILSPRICGDRAEACDGFVFRTALAIRSFFSDLHEGVRRPHTIAQVARPMDEAARRSLGVDEMIASHEMGGRLLAQTVTCPGITRFFDEILDCDDDSNEVYSCPLPRSLVGKPARFWPVVEHCAKTGHNQEPVLPIGLELAHRSGAPEGQGLPRVLLNPTVEELVKVGATTFESGDRILFLADHLEAARHLEAKEG